VPSKTDKTVVGENLKMHIGKCFRVDVVSNIASHLWLTPFARDQ
jgi:hypothetical protein